MHAIHQTNTRSRMRVAIVGAGMTGVTLASFLQGADVDALLLEQSEFRRRGVYPGVFDATDLHALGVELDAGVGISTVVRTDHGQSVPTSTSHLVDWRAIPHGQVLGAVKASLAGSNVEIVRDFLVSELMLADGAVTGVRDGVRGSTVDADVVVLADESDPRLPERIGLRPEWLPTELVHLGKARLDATPQHMAAAFGDDPATWPVISVRLAASWGATGIGLAIPEQDAVTVVAAMLLEDEMVHSRHIREFLDEIILLPEVARVLPKPVGDEFWTEVIPVRGHRRRPRLYADGFLLMNDLAGMTNPLLRDGVSDNLKMCAAAAMTIQDGTRKGDFSARTLKAYQRRMEKEVFEAARRGWRGAALSLDWAGTSKPELATYTAAVTKQPEAVPRTMDDGKGDAFRRLRRIGRRPD